MTDAMTLFIDNSKTYIQLSTGALVLTTAFVRNILGVQKDKPIPRDWWLMASWVFFLLTIMAGSFYQYTAARRLEHNTIMNIQLPFGTMLTSFYFGALCFTVMAIRKIITPAPREKRMEVEDESR